MKLIDLEFHKPENSGNDSGNDRGTPKNPPTLKPAEPNTRDYIDKGNKPTIIRKG